MGWGREFSPTGCWKAMHFLDFAGYINVQNTITCLINRAAKFKVNSVKKGRKIHLLSFVA